MANKNTIRGSCHPKTPRGPKVSSPYSKPKVFDLFESTTPLTNYILSVAPLWDSGAQLCHPLPAEPAPSHHFLNTLPCGVFPQPPLFSPLLGSPLGSHSCCPWSLSAPLQPKERCLLTLPHRGLGSRAVFPIGLSGTLHQGACLSGVPQQVGELHGFAGGLPFSCTPASCAPPTIWLVGMQFPSQASMGGEQSPQTLGKRYSSMGEAGGRGLGEGGKRGLNSLAGISLGFPGSVSGGGGGLLSFLPTLLIPSIAAVTKSPS
uniref:Uncharacterized protein n=1 Tax=Podarcis muralis TaxID=64176 RepID=A0A670IHU3_PODMU